MLRLEIREHQNALSGSFRWSVGYDVYDPKTFGWTSYVDAHADMSKWCRELWGPPVGEIPGVEALWMILGKVLYVRTQEQAIEARLRWHGASRSEG